MPTKPSSPPSLAIKVVLGPLPAGLQFLLSSLFYITCIYDYSGYRVLLLLLLRYGDGCARLRQQQLPPSSAEYFIAPSILFGLLYTLGLLLLPLATTNAAEI